MEVQVAQSGRWRQEGRDCQGWRRQGSCSRRGLFRYFGAVGLSSFVRSFFSLAPALSSSASSAALPTFRFLPPDVGFFVWSYHRNYFCSLSPSPCSRRQACPWHFLFWSVAPWFCAGGWLFDFVQQHIFRFPFSACLRIIFFFFFPLPPPALAGWLVGWLVGSRQQQQQLDELAPSRAQGHFVQRGACHPPQPTHQKPRPLARARACCCCV